MALPPWLRSRAKAEPEPPLEPPIRLGNFSNGEFFHEQTPLERRIRREILTQADDKARRLGIDRRAFLASAMGMTTSLSVLNLASSCSSDESGAARSGPDGGMPSAGGGYAIPPDATMDCELAQSVVDEGREFIFDIQTHHIEQEGSWRTTNPASGQTLGAYFASYNGCIQGDPTLCIDAQAYLERIFLESETAIAVLS